MCTIPPKFCKRVLYVNPTVEWLSDKSVLYIAVAAVVLIIISVIPSLLLCIYPTRVYRYPSRFLSARKRLTITAFAEALHSCFKDGLNGTRDYRALAGTALFVALLLKAVYYFINPWHACAARVTVVVHVRLSVR